MGAIEAHRLTKFADEIVITEPAESPTPSNDRWLLASQLQKSIRRGHVPYARSAALALLHHDPIYLWRRLRVIAVEDIGLADTYLMATTMAIAGKRVLQKKLGEVAVALAIVRQLCDSIKNRTACELSCWVDFSSRTSSIRQDLLQQSSDEWKRVATSHSSDALSRAVAWQLLGGAVERMPQGYRALSKFQGDVIASILDEYERDDAVA